jgi:hypothetical protein
MTVLNILLRAIEEPMRGRGMEGATVVKGRRNQ